MQIGLSPDETMVQVLQLESKVTKASVPHCGTIKAADGRALTERHWEQLENIC